MLHVLRLPREQPALSEKRAILLLLSGAMKDAALPIFGSFAGIYGEKRSSHITRGSDDLAAPKDNSVRGEPKVATA